MRLPVDAWVLLQMFAPTYQTCSAVLLGSILLRSSVEILKDVNKNQTATQKKKGRKVFSIKKSRANKRTGKSNLSEKQRDGVAESDKADRGQRMSRGVAGLQRHNM